jgi:acyl-CoA dehydrogenase
VWSFETDPEFQAQLDWIDTFTREEIEPLDLVFREPGDPWDPKSPAFKAMEPLREIVKEKRLWACHLEPELGGQGYGQVNLGLMNEILGRSRFGPSVFGCQAPDSGNAEILAKFGTPEQKTKYLQPLLNAEIASCYSMTEPQAGADPGEFLCTATRDGNEWVINGEKWFASHARFSAFLLVMVVTDTEAPIHQGASIFLVEQGTPAWTSSATLRSVLMLSKAMAFTLISLLKTAEFPRTIYSEKRGKAFMSHKHDWVADESTMPCAPWA